MSNFIVIALVVIAFVVSISNLIEIMKKRRKTVIMSEYRIIENAFDKWYQRNREFPSRIIVPRAMFEAFKKDVESTGHALTIWSIAVEPGDVSEIHFVRS